MEIFVEWDKTRDISDDYLFPDHFNPFFYIPRTVFLAQYFCTIPGISYEVVPEATHYEVSYFLRPVYGSQKHLLALWSAEDQVAEFRPTPSKSSALFWELYLRSITGDPGLLLIHILTGIDPEQDNIRYHLYGTIRSW